MKTRKFHFTQVLFKNTRGSALLSTMIMGFVGMIVGASALELVSLVNKANQSTRQRAELENFSVRVKNALTFEVDCSDVLGNVVYNGTPANAQKLEVRSIDDTGAVVTQNYLNNQTFISPGFKLNAVRITEPILNASASPMPIVVGNQTIDFKRYVTYIELDAEKVGGIKLAPEKIMATIYTRANNNQIEFCAASADAEECTNMGGVFTPGQNNAGSFCDLRPAIGGCAEGGHYMIVSGQGCAAGNIHMPLGPGQYDCACPTGFVAQEVMNFAASKNSYMYQYVCLNCAGAVTPGAGLADSRGILYDADALERDLACLQGVTNPTDPDYLASCPCSTQYEGGNGGPTSTACGCQQGTITGSQCNDVCTYYPNSCDCTGDICQCDPNACYYNIWPF